MTHTPGPWHVSPHSSICDASGTAFARMLSSARMSPRTLANARLMAASPDLLKALQEIAEQTVEGGTLNSIARAAIAQAKTTEETA